MMNFVRSYFSVNYPQCFERPRSIQQLVNTKKGTLSTHYQDGEMEW